MPTEDHSHQQSAKPEEGFPIQLKILVAVIALGILSLLLAATDFF